MERSVRTTTGSSPPDVTHPSRFLGNCFEVSSHPMRPVQPTLNPAPSHPGPSSTTITILPDWTSNRPSPDATTQDGPQPEYKADAGKLSPQEMVEHVVPRWEDVPGFSGRKQQRIFLERARRTGQNYGCVRYETQRHAATYRRSEINYSLSGPRTHER